LKKTDSRGEPAAQEFIKEKTKQGVHEEFSFRPGDEHLQVLKKMPVSNSFRSS